MRRRRGAGRRSSEVLPSRRCVWPIDHLDVGKAARRVLADQVAVRIDHGPGDSRAGEQRLEDVVKERATAERPVVLAGNSLALVSHRHDGDHIRRHDMSIGSGIGPLLGILVVDGPSGRAHRPWGGPSVRIVEVSSQRRRGLAALREAAIRADELGDAERGIEKDSWLALPSRARARSRWRYWRWRDGCASTTPMRCSR